eukprot:7667744-Pyramimonas_sp.AAC.1
MQPLSDLTNATEKSPGQPPSDPPAKKGHMVRARPSTARVHTATFRAPGPTPPHNAHNHSWRSPPTPFGFSFTPPLPKTLDEFHFENV